MHRIVALLSLTALLCGNASGADQPLDPDESGITGASRRTYSFNAKPRIERLDFDFRIGESNAWLNSGGDFHVHGWISHPGLLCATYKMGVRFGIGSPGCLNVDWLSGPVYVTSQYQCNGARVEHDGGDSMPDFGERIAAISCAERVVRCSGSCK